MELVIQILAITAYTLAIVHYVMHLIDDVKRGNSKLRK